MAICNLTKSLLKTNTCGYVLNEIKDIYLTNYNDISASTLGYDCESGVTVTELALSGTAKWYHIEPAQDSVSYTDELVVEDNGSKYRTHTLTFSIAGNYDKDLVCSIDALSLGRFIVVVKTASGQYLVLGRATGLEASEQSVAGGGDNNGITVTLSGNVAESAAPLGESAITAMLANVA